MIRERQDQPAGEAEAELATAEDQPRGDPDGLDQARGPRPARPGDVEGRAVGDAGPDDRQAERHVDRALEAEGLEGDVPLVVVHRHHGVELAGDGADEEGVGGDRPGHVDPGRLRRATAGAMIRVSSSPNSPPSPACGLSAGDRHARAPPAGQRAQRPVGQQDLLLDRGDRQQVEDPPQRDVERGVDHAEPGVARAAGGADVEHHRMVGHAAALGQDLGVAGVADAAGVERLLVQRQRRDRVDPPGQGQVDGRDQEVVGRPARPRIDPARAGRRPGLASVASRQGIDPRASARPPRAGRSPGPRPGRPTQARARSSTDRLPTTNGRARVRSGESSQARAMTSGPTPATSPIVRATSGLSSLGITAASSPQSYRIDVVPTRPVNAWRWPGAAWSRPCAAASSPPDAAVGVTGTTRVRCGLATAGEAERAIRQIATQRTHDAGLSCARFTESPHPRDYRRPALLLSRRKTRSDLRPSARERGKLCSRRGCG